MRILVYGAGVIGANLAADLFSSGRDVTLLARGPWADVLEQKGLRVKPAFFPKRRTYPIPVVRELKSDDEYDAIFVVLRFSQLESVLPILRNNVSRTITAKNTGSCASGSIGSCVPPSSGRSAPRTTP